MLGEPKGFFLALRISVQMLPQSLELLPSPLLVMIDAFLLAGSSPSSELGEGQVRCPVCGLHLQAGDIGPHYAQEVDRLMLFFK